MPNLTPERIAEMERLDGLATKGPWEAREFAFEPAPGRPKRRIYRVEIMQPIIQYGKRVGSRLVAQIIDFCDWTDHPANRDFICLSRSFIPDAIRDLADLQSELSTIRAEMLADREIKKRLEEEREISTNSYITLREVWAQEKDELQRENADLKRRIEAAPHNPHCAYAPFETCANCGFGFSSHPQGECINAPECRWSPRPPRPCNCWKSQAEQKGSEHAGN